MTREEEIEKAATYYAELVDKEYDISPSMKRIVKNAYWAGANWADEHPVNVWHEASEMPKDGEWILIQFDEDSYDTLVFCDMDAVAFCTCCKKCGSIRWAYISDLLPKGGEK